LTTEGKDGNDMEDGQSDEQWVKGRHGRRETYTRKETVN
jgi:hypothetical protein